MIKTYKIKEVCRIVGVTDEVVFELVRKEWIQPVLPEKNELEKTEFDDEDLARIRLILELMNNLEVNEGAMPIVLHLIDQIHRLHFELRNRSQNDDRP